MSNLKHIASPLPLRRRSVAFAHVRNGQPKLVVVNLMDAGSSAQYRGLRSRLSTRPRSPAMAAAARRAGQAVIRRMAWVEDMPAWHVGEGDVLVNGYRVVSVRREPRTRSVRIGTTEPAVAQLPHDGVVPVVRR